MFSPRQTNKSEESQEPSIKRRTEQRTSQYFLKLVIMSAIEDTFRKGLRAARLDRVFPS